jgi:hypothetical protein
MEQITTPNNHIPQPLLPEKVDSNSTEKNACLESSSIEENNGLSSVKPFIEANTIASSFEEITNNHIIPVFIKDNETLISQAEFIELTNECVSAVYPRERILSPSIRLSHPVKGRIPSAKEKPVNELQEHEKTLYYERMAFVIEIPTISDTIAGNQLNLTIGGVKAFNLDNLYSKKGTDQHFKVFIGFENTVCTNLCVWSDGLIGDLAVKNSQQLKACIKSVLESYNATYHLYHLEQLAQYCLTEHQFAQLIGRCRMYPHLPRQIQSQIIPLRLGDAQINSVVTDYYKDQSFCRQENGEINLWNLYNLFTTANKSTYIDSFLDRSVSAYQFVEQLKVAVQLKSDNWFLN